MANRTRVLVLPGDCIGPEIVAATLTVLDAASARDDLGFAWRTEEVGFLGPEKRGSTMPDDVMEAARQAPGIILGRSRTSPAPVAYRARVRPRSIDPGPGGESSWSPKERE